MGSRVRQTKRWLAWWVSKTSLRFYSVMECDDVVADRFDFFFGEPFGTVPSAVDHQPFSEVWLRRENVGDFMGTTE